MWDQSPVCMVRVRVRVLPATGLRDFQKGLLPIWLADRIKGKSVLWTKCWRDHDTVQDPSESIPNLLVWMPQLASDIKLKGTLVVSDGEIP